MQMIFQKELLKSLQANGEKPAIEDARRTVTYSEVLTGADKVTRFLLDQGAGNETFVGILLPDRIDLIGALIGVINAGAVFVPIDGSLPEKRLSTLGHELDLKFLLTSRNAAQPKSFSGAQTFFVEDILATEAAAGDFAYPAYDENDSLYVYFTSGSTGTPKGIVGKNASLLQFVRWEIEAFGIDGNSRFSQFISPYFDAFLRDVFVPLLAGGTLCIPPQEEDFFTPEKMTAWIDARAITLIHCVPSLFRTINNDLLTPEHYQSLRYVLLSGEKIIPAQLRNWYDIFYARIQLVNLYGPTETTMVRSYYLIKPADAHQFRIPIGKPIAGTELLIANEDLKPCSPLVPGDLYIITHYATKGYLNNPALTREKFITLRAGTPEAALAFKTGDKARLLSNGEIDLIGREDRQVKMSGIRIELDEIETTLVQSERVKDAVVVKYEEDGGNKPDGTVPAGTEALVAFVTREDGLPEGLDFEAAVRQHLQEYLPKYMIPQRIIAVEAFPLLSNGKINHKALANLLDAGTAAVVAPTNEVEEKLLRIWKEILGDKVISTEDNFQKIGGGSLALMRLIGRIHGEYKVRISLRELFNNTTIKQQAGFIRETLHQRDQQAKSQEQYTF